MLKSRLEHVELRVGRILHEPGRSIEFSYFLNSGLVSLVVETENGRTVEVGVNGYEGMTGVALLGGLAKTTHRAVIQVAGEGTRLRADVLQDILSSLPQLHAIGNRFAAVQAMQVAQTAACNRLHSVAQRMARWLLMTDDRVPRRSLSVTHDFMSMMLGTDRPSVTNAMKGLRHERAIRYGRGKLAIIDREKIQRSVCDCYRALQVFDIELGLNRMHHLVPGARNSNLLSAA